MNHSNFNKERRALLTRLLTLGAAGAGVGLLPVRVLAASSTSVSDLRVATKGDKTRVVISLDGPAQHSLFTLHNPERVVIDFDQAHAGAGLKTQGDALVKDVRYAARNSNDLRLVLDLKSHAQPNSFLLSPSGKYKHYRLVIDLEGEAASPPTKAAKPKPLRDLVVCIDPGHGGHDPGAIGKHGTYEKHVVLPIAQDLHDRLNRQRGIKAVLTRNTDVYLHLRERTRIAHKHNADLFMSVHADAFSDRSVTGSSVYVLSEHGASSEMARELARSQNGVDPLVTMNLSDKPEVLRSVLLDLAQTAAMSSSDRLAEKLLGHLKNKHNDRVNRAAFVVLKSPDIPSVLVETAFISNPRQEKLLRTKAFQQRIARSMHDGVMSYFKQFAPSDTLLASLTRNQTTG